MFGQVFQSTNAFVKFMLISLNIILLFNHVPSDCTCRVIIFFTILDFMTFNYQGKLFESEIGEAKFSWAICVSKQESMLCFNYQHMEPTWWQKYYWDLNLYEYNFQMIILAFYKAGIITSSTSVQMIIKYQRKIHFSWIKSFFATINFCNCASYICYLYVCCVLNFCSRIILIVEYDSQKSTATNSTPNYF